MSTLALRITGMTCQHCADSAEAALNALPGVRATVD
ncbi:MAG TPA: copper chaperone, partial [Gammaproteobacteria bacterium]|nr:copper chaperone [Gammaproteobacteria bacterium]